MKQFITALKRTAKLLASIFDFEERHAFKKDDTCYWCGIHKTDSRRNDGICRNSQNA